MTAPTDATGAMTAPASPCDAQVTMDDPPHPEMPRVIDAAIKAAEYERVAKTMEHEPSAYRLQMLAVALRIACEKILARVAREGGDV